MERLKCEVIETQENDKKQGMSSNRAPSAVSEVSALQVNEKNRIFFLNSFPQIKNCCLSP